MTTKVTVFAHAGWAVDVFPIARDLRGDGAPVRVEAGETRDFYVHSSQELLVREVLPGRALSGPPQPYLGVVEKDMIEGIEAFRTLKGADARWLSIAKTQIEQGFLALERALRDCEQS